MLASLIYFLLICYFCILFARKKRNVKLLIYFPFKAFAGPGYPTVYFGATIQACLSPYRRSCCAVWGLNSDPLSEKGGTGGGTSQGTDKRGEGGE